MRRQWVFRDPCGCAFGVMENVGQTTAEAWFDFYSAGTKAKTERAIGGAVARGVTMVDVPHEEYVEQFQPQIRSSYTCPHGGA